MAQRAALSHIQTIASDFPPVAIWTPFIFRAGAATFALLALVTLALPLLSDNLRWGRGQLAFETDRDGNWEIYVLDVATGLERNLTRRTAQDLSPSWSPDGSQIAFHTDEDGDGTAELFVIDADGGNPHRLMPPDGGNNWRPSWSPDGERVTYMMGYQLIQVVNVSDGLAQNYGRGFSPSWSPDGGRLIYYADPDGHLNTDIYMLDVRTKRAYNLTMNAANDWSPAWSPDGHTIAFVSMRDGNNEIYLIDALCTADISRIGGCPRTVHRLTDSLQNEIAPAWSADAHELAFVSKRDDVDQIFVMNTDGSGVQRVTYNLANNRLPVWKP
jgi:Tol biopolymer transport system component